ncbi:UDP-glucosyltransferase 2-like [Epargyreus clarus]|uniref:UDP-glucosyltransferase 2-like n=1 Tax=Epargyreus clarus TaxID=520877 RepID=UPI003C2E7F2C
MDKYIIVAIVIIINATEIDSARILAVFPTPSISHQVVFRPLTLELVKRGHEVVVITTHPAFPPGEAPENLTEIDVGNVSVESWRKRYTNADIGKRKDLYKQIKSFVQVIDVFFEKQLQTKQIQDIVKNKKNDTFNLLLLEMCVRPALAFSHVYEAPVILISSHGPFLEIMERVGVPNHPLLYPVIPRQRLYNLTYWETFKELFSYYSMKYVYHLMEDEENNMLKKYFGSDIPPLSKLYKNVAMFLDNVHPYFLDNIPVPHNVIYIGGLHQEPAKELPQDLSLYLNNSKNGVIYVSFGTNIRTSLLLPEKVQIMIKVFSNLPYDILWKMDTTELSGTSNNIKISEWLPQADLLKHPKIKVFITQGGLQSTDEAITAGVPLIGIPICCDQWYNVEKYVRLNIGIKLDWYSLTEDELRTAILTVTENSSYKKNIRRLRSIITDQPQSPLERAILWIEYVLRHGGAKHLRAPAANMSWTEYYELDLIIIIIISLFVALLFSLLSIYFIWQSLVKVLRSDKNNKS